MQEARIVANRDGKRARPGAAEEKPVKKLRATRTPVAQSDSEEEAADEEAEHTTDADIGNEDAADDLFGESDHDIDEEQNARSSNGSMAAQQGDPERNEDDVSVLALVPPMARSALRRPREPRHRLSLSDDSQASQQIVMMPAIRQQQAIARTDVCRQEQTLAVQMRGYVGGACWYECGTCHDLTNIGNATYPKMACKPCQKARRAWLSQRNGRGAAVKKACDDFCRNQQAKYKEVIRTARIDIVDGDIPISICCFFWQLLIMYV